MEKNLKSGKIVYPPDKTGCEKIMKDVYKKSSRGCTCTSERSWKNLQDIAKNGIIKDHVRWVKTHINEEDSTHNYNIINDEEFISFQSSDESTETCCVVCLTRYKKSDHEKLNKRSKKPKNLVCLGFL